MSVKVKVIPPVQPTIEVDLGTANCPNTNQLLPYGLGGAGGGPTVVYLRKTLSIQEAIQLRDGLNDALRDAVNERVGG